MNELKVIKGEKDWTQVCVIEGVLLDNDISGFEAAMLKELGVRVKFIGEIETLPDKDEAGMNIEGTGGRHDVFFYIHSDDMMKFAVPRFKFGVRWWEDVLGNGNGSIYPKEVLEALPPTWNFDAIAAWQKPVHISEESGKPKLKLMGVDGNVFVIVSEAKRMAKRALPHKEEELVQRCFTAKSYDDVLAVISEYFEIY